MRDFEARRMKLAGGSPTVALNAKGIRMKEEGIDVLSFAAGEPDFDTPEAVKAAAIEAIRHNDTHYTSAAGTLALRRRIVKKLREENGIDAQEDGILVTPGAKLALYAAMTCFLEEGDECMVPTPAYPSYRSGILMAGATYVPVPLSFDDGFVITRAMLEAKVTERSKMLIVCNPCNPTGHVLTRQEVRDIADFVLQHDMLLIADEIYEKLIYDGREHLSLGALPEIRDRVITLNGLSKSAAMTGWRIGYSAASPELTKVMLKLQQNTVNCTAAFTQTASVTALDCAEDAERMRLSYLERRDLICDGLNAVPCITCPRAEGAFYAFFRIDYRGMSAEQLADYILEKAGILVVPGTAFGEGGEKCIRLSFAASRESLQEAVRRLSALFAE
ncbi:MAG: pyridoxal phosphate-dependent aminotransferase [Oscillospiraceae bacterium]|nr:pyridoxal phosphate-dependent aminotransferase [Oscillospiraceae bacterium]